MIPEPTAGMPQSPAPLDRDDAAMPRGAQDQT
jgi:hypothetical protein